MSDSFWKRLSSIFGLLALMGIFGLLIFSANLEIKDLDLWLHIGVGRYIVEHGFQVPSVDILSCTISGKPWVNHEWLFQIIVYFINQFSGADGLITMQVVLVTLTMLILVFLGYNREKQLGSIFILLLVSIVYQGRFTIRPDLYSLLFFALYIFLLSFYLDRKWSLYFLFLIQVLWTNMHGFFFFGPLFVLIGLIAEWLKRHVKLPYEWNKTGRLTNDEYARLKWILAFVVLACLLNPLALKGAWYPLKVFFQISGESKIFFSKIIELQKPITWNDIFSINDYAFYKLLILLSFLSFVYNRRKIDIGILIFWIIFLVFSLSALRNMIFFAFAAYLVFVTNALTVSFKDIVPMRFIEKKFIYITSIVIKILLILWVAQYAIDISGNGYFDFDAYERKSEFGGISLRNYPYKAADFLVENKVKGNFFNDFNSGAYLVGRCSPGIKVFIDGRTEVYGPQFFKYYEELWDKDNAEAFEKALEKYNITGVFLDSVFHPIPEKVAQFLYHSKEWVPVYLDFDGMVFLKDVPQNKDLINRFRLDLKNWQAKELDMYRLGSKNVTPYQHVNRAFTLESLGLDEAAIAEAREAVRINPSYVDPYKLIGKVYAKKKDYQSAFENFRIAVLLSPQDQKARQNLAQAYYDLGEYKYAADQYQRILEIWPTDPLAHFSLSRICVKQGKPQKALEYLRKAFQLDPKAVKDVLDVGDLLFDNGFYESAKDAYVLLTSQDPKNAQAHQKLGLAYEKLNQKEKAREEFEKSLQIQQNKEQVPTDSKKIKGSSRRHKQ
jgi:tetratricopeptide (TPR) repeat protein